MAAPPPSTTAGLPPAASAPSPSFSSLPPPAPKILLAKPAPGAAAPKFPRDDDSAALRSRSPSVTSLNLLSFDSWEFHTDRALPFLTENTDFTVIGVIGPPAVGKSTILNELYGFDGTSPGMLPPFLLQSEETKAMAKHCTVGIEMRVSSERLILLDSQPVFSPSILAEMIKPDGSSAVPVLNGEPLSADLAHELMCLQLGAFLSSICHIVLVVSEGVHDTSMWHLMQTVDLLKHGIPDPSLSSAPGYSQNSNTGQDKDLKESSEDFLAEPVFVHTKLQEQDLSPSTVAMLRKALRRYFDGSSLCRNTTKQLMDISCVDTNKLSSVGENIFLLPLRVPDDLHRYQYESYASKLKKLSEQIFSMNRRNFTKAVSEKDWVRNSAKIWEMVKKSPIIAEYCRTLQSSGLFRR